MDANNITTGDGCGLPDTVQDFIYSLGSVGDDPEDNMLVKDPRIKIITLTAMIEKYNRAQMDRDLEKVNLTFMQSSVIFYIMMKKDRDPECPITSRSLEKLFQVSNPTMSGILKRLEQKGFIERVPGTVDKREKEICISEEAYELFVFMREMGFESLNHIFEGFSPEDIDRLSAYLSRIAVNIKLLKSERTALKDILMKGRENK